MTDRFYGADLGDTIGIEPNRLAAPPIDGQARHIGVGYAKHLGATGHDRLLGLGDFFGCRRGRLKGGMTVIAVPGDGARGRFRAWR